MSYILKHFDTPLIKFEVCDNLDTPVLHILWADENNKKLLPLGLSLTNEGLAHWLKHRSIPKNRAFVHRFLAQCGLSINRPMDTISVSKGLSLNDSYWVTTEEDTRTFKDTNLYDNRFNTLLSQIAFTGYGSRIRTSLLSSPEFTTNGMLPKCWRRINGKIYLFKGGTSGASNTGCEPYSEYYSTQIAEALGINHISYNIKKWKGILCSTCELFTSKSISFVPVGNIITSGGFEAVLAFYTKLGFASAFTDMLIFDALICNVDRHYGNFGFLVDSVSNTIIAPAPLFDHGNSLFNLAGKENFKDIKTLNRYVDTLYPCTYDDFIKTTVDRITHSDKDKIKKLLTFNFKKHPRYNYETKQLNLMSKMIQNRAKKLL